MGIVLELQRYFAKMEIKRTVISGLFLLGATILIVAGEKKKLKMVLDKLDKANDAEHILKTDITFDKVGDDEVKINGQVEQMIDIGEEYTVNMEIFHASEKDGEFKKMLGFANQPVCEIMANQYKKYFYDTLKNHCNAPDPDTCPVTKETYIVKDYPLDSSKFEKYLRPGFYKIIISLIHKDEEVLQYIVEGHTEEEQE